MLRLEDDTKVFKVMFEDRWVKPLASLKEHSCLLSINKDFEVL